MRGVHDWIAPGMVRRLDGAHIALTFDDGPHEERTPAILEELSRARVRATFFLVGERAERYPDLVRRIAAEGHALGNHSWSHAWLLGSRRHRIEEELDRCQDSIFRLTGRAPTLVRPPFGHRDVRFNLAIRERGLRCVLWSLDTFDYVGLSAELVFRRARAAKAGEVLLFHDGNPGARGTREGLSLFLSDFARRGRSNEFVELGSGLDELTR